MVKGAANLRAYNDGKPAGAPFVSLFLQRVGDNLSAQGDYVNYRFYCKGSVKIEDGQHVLDVPVNDTAWHNVYGQQSKAGMDTTLANLRVFGLVFGNPGAGATAHGVGGGGRFTLLSIEQG